MERTIREYAEQEGITYEAARQRIARAGAEITPHIVTRGKTKYLTDEAQELLNNYAYKVPLVRVADDRQALIDKLRADAEARTAKIIELQDRLLAVAEKAAKLEAVEREKLLLEKLADDIRKDNEAYLEQIRVKDTKIQTLEAEKAAGEEELKEARGELESYHKTIFGLYRKTKNDSEN